MTAVFLLWAQASLQRGYMGHERQLSKRGPRYQSTSSAHSLLTKHHTYSKYICFTNTDILHTHTRDLKEKQGTQGTLRKTQA